MIENANVEEVFICTCHGEGVIVRGDEDFVFLSIWGYGNNVSLRWRIKQAWSALRGSSCSEVVLTARTAAALAEQLVCKANCINGN